MPIRIRFGLWIICVAGILLFTPLASRQFSTDYIGKAFVALTAISIACYLGLVFLLHTTPPDAIKLPPRQSVRWIAAGTIWLYFFCYGPLLAPEASAPDIWIVGLVMVAALALFAGTVAYFLARQVITRNMSPWSVTVILWMPAFVGPFGHPVFAALMLAGLTLVIVLNLGRLPN